MDLFKVSPELRQTFSFFEYYKIDDEKFYKLVTKHGLRILGMVSQLVKQVCNDLKCTGERICQLLSNLKFLIRVNSILDIMIEKFG